MPKGPRGEHRPADTNKLAHMIVGIATGEIAEAQNNAGRTKAGKVGGNKRSEKLTPERKREIAIKGAGNFTN